MIYQGTVFGQILEFLNNTKVVYTVHKTKEVDNKTVTTVTVYYPCDWLLYFRLKDWTFIRFILTPDGIFFETETTIYKVSVSHELISMIESFT